MKQAKEKMLQNELWPEDKKLFESMEGHYQSDSEREFFEKQRYKEEHVMTSANDLLMSEFSNDDHIYIVRCWYEEYIVGCGNNEEHYMNLHDALDANLKQIGVANKDITLFQWLRDRDYKGVEYNHNFDDL